MNDLIRLVEEWKRTKSITTANEVMRRLDKITISDALVEQVIDWGREHHIDNPHRQLNKVLEEVGEIAHEMTRDNLNSEEMQDALGDTLVTIIILADILNFDPLFCLQEAYDTIRTRKGITRDGNFIKSNS